MKAKILFLLFASFLAMTAQEFVVNPSIQRYEVTRSNEFKHLGDTFNVVAREGAIADAISRGEMPWLKQSAEGVQLTIDYVDFPPELKGRTAGTNANGAYAMIIDDDGIRISGMGEDGAFYALQTLRQIVEENPAGLPHAQIYDFPVIPYRGLVEGFYGEPWSHEVRLSLIDFMGRHKLNKYVYGPKDDEYHRNLWRKPYPEKEAEQIKELVEASKRNHVEFVWAIHPGVDINWGKADIDSLNMKLEGMYDLGVRSFSIFFDDIQGEGARSDRQVELLNDIAENFVRAKGDITGLIICPTDYSQTWANPTDDGQLAYYGRHLDPAVDVFFTGNGVMSDLTPETLEFVNSRIKRPVYFWWNYPVTDYCRTQVLQGPVYGLDPNVTALQVGAFLSNPMEHGEASKLALYSVADYSWNPKQYDPMDSWQRALTELLPDAPDAYRVFGMHSANSYQLRNGSGWGYERDESWEVEPFDIDNYTAEQYEAMMRQFLQMEEASEKMLASKSNPALMAELRPWVEQMGVLGRHGRAALELLEIRKTGSDGDINRAYEAAKMTDAEREAFEAHRLATAKLYPFYLSIIESVAPRP